MLQFEPSSPLHIVTDPEQQTMRAMDSVKKLLTAMSAVRKGINCLNQTSLSLLPDARIIKVRHHTRKGCHKQEIIPQVTLSGLWLKRNRFFCQYVQVITLPELIVMVPTNLIEDPYVIDDNPA